MNQYSIYLLNLHIKSNYVLETYHEIVVYKSTCSFPKVPLDQGITLISLYECYK